MSNVAAERGHWPRFALHYAEMVVAMFAGMMVFGAVVEGIAAAADLGYSAERQPALASVVMTVDMALGMAIWMRLRGHPRAGIAEMSGVMFVPLPVLLPLLWLDVISDETLMVLLHVAMFPLMLLVMLRRRAAHGVRS
ncbi:hypothetical protein ACFWU3_22095 [Streptomyces sp. NPDC058685]|uniref:hypothetical protein n=1 Tax=Streptomyces sp. NPDC058685 TaxID=3346598 RepID=UPI0036565197